MSHEGAEFEHTAKDAKRGRPAASFEQFKGPGKKYAPKPPRKKAKAPAPSTTTPEKQMAFARMLRGGSVEGEINARNYENSEAAQEAAKYLR